MTPAWTREVPKVSGHYDWRNESNCACCQSTHAENLRVVASDGVVLVEHPYDGSWREVNYYEFAGGEWRLTPPRDGG